MIPFHCISCGYNFIAEVVEEKEPIISVWKGEKIEAYGCRKYIECYRCGFTALINPFGAKPDIIKIIHTHLDITSADGSYRGEGTVSLNHDQREKIIRSGIAPIHVTQAGRTLNQYLEEKYD